MSNEHDALCRCAFARQMDDTKQGRYGVVPVCYWDNRTCTDTKCKYNIQIAGKYETVQSFIEIVQEQDEEVNKH